MTEEIVILGGARTAIGTFGGALAGVPPIDLATTAAKAALERSGVEGAQLGHVVFGHIINTEPRDMYLSRVAAMQAGAPESVPAMNVNRLCGSGVQAIVSAAQSLMLGDATMALAGGSESMSRSPYIVPAIRWGQKMGDTGATDMMLGALNCPFGTGHMGVTAENVAAEYDITREAQDAFALQSQERALNALKEGYFKSQIVPVEVKVKRNTASFDTDEHPKASTVEMLGKLRPAFQKDGTVTAGNASSLNDGAAAVIVCSADKANELGLTPLATIKAHANAGVDPTIMGTGPIPASQRCLQRAGWSVDELDLVEANEAFAAQACAVNKDMGWDPSIVNVNGGAIAIGHPIGASGARVLNTLLFEMKRRDAKKGLATLCIGGGMGVALCVERD